MCILKQKIHDKLLTIEKNMEKTQEWPKSQAKVDKKATKLLKIDKKLVLCEF